jgi:hypothetical protein
MYVIIRVLRSFRDITRLCHVLCEVHFWVTQLICAQLSPRLCSSRYVSKVRSRFVSCHGRKCRGVWSSATQSSSARNSENLVPKRCSFWGQLLGMLFCLQPKSSGDTRRSRREGRALRTNSAQDVLQLQELRTMWLVWRLFWIGTDVWVCG